MGVVPVTLRGDDGRSHRTQLEIDFVCNRGSRRCYVQSAFALPDSEERARDERPLLRVGDGFKKVIVSKDGLAPHYDENGVLMLNVYNTLLDESGLDF